MQLIVAETLKRRLSCLNTCQHLVEGQFLTTAACLHLCFLESGPLITNSLFYFSFIWKMFSLFRVSWVNTTPSLELPGWKSHSFSRHKNFVHFVSCCFHGTSYSLWVLVANKFFLVFDGLSFLLIIFIWIILFCWWRYSVLTI